MTGQPEYQNAACAFCDFSVRQQKRTPKGLLYIDKFGTLCHAANVAFVCLQAADYPNIGDPKEYREFATQQISYMLGDIGKRIKLNDITLLIKSSQTISKNNIDIKKTMKKKKEEKKTKRKKEREKKSKENILNITLY